MHDKGSHCLILKKIAVANLARYCVTSVVHHDAVWALWAPLDLRSKAMLDYQARVCTSIIRQKEHLNSNSVAI